MRLRHWLRPRVLLTVGAYPQQARHCHRARLPGSDPRSPRNCTDGGAVAVPGVAGAGAPASGASGSSTTAGGAAGSTRSSQDAAQGQEAQEVGATRCGGRSNGAPPGSAAQPARTNADAKYSSDSERPRSRVGHGSLASTRASPMPPSLTQATRDFTSQRRETEDEMESGPCSAGRREST
jgi:hypothetical protein